MRGLTDLQKLTEFMRAFPGLKDRLGVNVELVWPPHFLPELPGWRERSRFIAREGALSFSLRRSLEAALAAT